METKVMKNCLMAFFSAIYMIYTPLNAIHFEECLPVGVMPQHQLKALCNTVLVIICLHKIHQTVIIIIIIVVVIIHS